MKTVVINCPCYINDDECRENSLIRQRCDTREDCIIKKIIANKETFEIVEAKDA